MFSAKDTRLTRPSGAFVIPRSLRFRASASAYLNRTFGTPTDVKTQTFSLWIKRGLLGNGAAEYYLLTSGSGGTECRLVFNTDDTFTVFLNNVTYRTTTQVFRDPSAWYHLVFVLDTANATANSRFLMYVNGVVVSSFSVNSAITQNATFSMFSAVAHNLCRRIATSADYLDGYLAEVNLVDGQALTPSSFGATNTTTGVWSPINYGGTYGTNGYHLTFNSYATTAALGTDTSGNSNTWTVNGCSVTAGVTYDSMIDVPTVTDTGSNYAVLNPLDLTNGSTNATATFSQGNLAVSSGSGNQLILGSIGMDSGLYYWECTTTTGTIGGSLSGVALTQATRNSYGGFDQYGWVLYYSTGTKLTNDTNAGNGVTYLGSGAIIGDVVCCAFNRTTGKIWWRVNNNAWGGAAGGDPVAGTGEAFSGLNTGTFYPCIDADSRATNFINFGQRPFAYTAPTGFNSLNTYNLAAPSILKGNLYMDATTYTGTGASLGVTNAGGFQPGFVWAKSRSAATDHALYDSVRGTTKQIESNTTTAETTEATGLTAFDSAGFTVGALAQMNTSAATYVGWQWKAGSTVTNTTGSRTTSVSASTISGCSVVTGSVQGVGVQDTFGHGLGITPQMILVKDTSGTYNWCNFHVSVSTNTSRYLVFTTAAVSTYSTVWGAALPTSSVFGLTGDGAVGANNNFVAYCFAPVAGYSAFGSYTGNGLTDGPFVYLGFRPRWLMLKRSSTASVTYGWQLYDTSRSPYNTTYLPGLWADALAAEAANTYPVDLLSNGFKFRDGGVNQNANGDTYIYAAFAESPFNNSLAR